MRTRLESRFEVVYYECGGRVVYWPADDNSDVLAAKLREARAAGHSGARLYEVGGRA